MFSILVTALSLSLLSSLTLGVPFTEERRSRLIVYNPKITNPNADTKWCIGMNVTVTWDASDIPAVAYNYTGKLLLGHGGQGQDSEHLDVESPLAQGFLLRSETQNVTVPLVEPRKDYIAVLMGDSGNSSPPFEICDCSGKEGINDIGAIGGGSGGESNDETNRTLIGHQSAR